MSMTYDFGTNMKILTVSREAQRVINYNLRVDKERADGYILYQNKHLRRDSMNPKMRKLQQLIEKLGGRIEFDAEPYIQGEDRCIKVLIKLQGPNKALLTKVK